MAKKVCVVTGVGPGTGAAIARRFSKEYEVAMIARTYERLSKLEQENISLHAYACDISNLLLLDNVYAHIVHDLGHPAVLIHNAVMGMFGSFEDIDSDRFEKAFRVNVTSFLRLAQLAAPNMIEDERGTIVCTGNTAAYRGSPNFAGFAPTKAAQRVLAESLARTLGPSGIHVAYVAIDAVISVPRNRKAMQDKPNEFFAQPEDIAEHVWHVVHQPKSTWTFDSIIRPFGERW